MAKFTYAQVVAATTPATNWSKFVVHPLADRLLWLLANYTHIQPNTLTLGASVLWVSAGVCYLQGTPAGMYAGAGLFYASFAIDAIDGALARILNKCTPLGAWLDSITDFLRSTFLASMFAVGAYRQTGDIRALCLGFGVMGVALSYLHLAELSQRFLGQRPFQIAVSGAARYGWFKKLGLVPSPFGLTDFEALYLIVFPLVGRPIEGMLISLVGGTLSRVAVGIILLRRLSRNDGGQLP